MESFSFYSNVFLAIEEPEIPSFSSLSTILKKQQKFFFKFQAFIQHFLKKMQGNSSFSC